MDIFWTVYLNHLSPLRGYFFTVDLIDNMCDSTQNQHGDQKGVCIITMIVIERNVRSIWSVVYQTQCIAL